MINDGDISCRGIYQSKLACIFSLILCLVGGDVYATRGVEQCFGNTGGNVTWRNGDINFYVDDAIWNNAQLRGELLDAVDFWNTASKDHVEIQLTQDVGTGMRFDNSVNEIYFANLSGSTIGNAKTEWGFDCKYNEADIRFDAGRDWRGQDELGDPSTPWLNIGLVMVHELGHTLGLKHDNTHHRSMNTNYPNGGPIGEPHEERPHAYDVNKIRQVYSVGSTHIDLVASRWYLEPDTNGIAFPIDLLRDDRSTPTNNSVSGGENVFFPYFIQNMSTITKDLRVEFFISSDRYMGSSGDINLGMSYYTLPRGTELAGDKYITVPDVPSGFYFFGYRITNYGGEHGHPNNNQVSLQGRYWVN